MNEQIQQELVLLLNIDNVTANDQIKILDDVFNQQDFDLSSEFTRLVLAILNLNKNVEYKKEINEIKVKYVIYACLYFYLIKYQVDFCNKTDMGKIRLLYCNSFELISLVPETIKVQKQSCLSCISWFRSGKISV